MSTNLQTTTESQPTTPTTEIESRGEIDPWTAPDETPSRSPSQRTQRQFEPTARERLKNLTDSENAYCR